MCKFKEVLQEFKRVINIITQSLETNYMCLQHVIEGCGPAFIPHLSDELLDLIYTGLKVSTHAHGQAASH